MAPGELANKSASTTDDFHAVVGHAHEVLRREIAEHQTIFFETQLMEYKGCSSFANGLRSSGFQPLRMKRYDLVVRDECSRNLWVHFLRHTSDATESFEQFRVDVREQTVSLPR